MNDQLRWMYNNRQQTLDDDMQADNSWHHSHCRKGSNPIFASTQAKPVVPLNFFSTNETQGKMGGLVIFPRN